MKKIYIIEKILISLVLAVVMCGCEYDDSALTDRVDELENRIEQLEKLCSGINSDIDALQQLVDALQSRDYVTAVEPLKENGQVTGYRILFQKADPVVISHGRDGAAGHDGADGADGYIPQIGVQQDSDGHYYWTVDGEWLLDENGAKISAEGVDGKDGADGQDGQDGQDGADGPDGVDGADGKPGADGKDGITPLVTIGEDGCWYYSLNDGNDWILLYDGVPAPGTDGADGTPSLFAGVEVIGDEVHIRLAGGGELVLPMAAEETAVAVTSMSLVGPSDYDLTRYTGWDDDTLKVSIAVFPAEALPALKANFKEVMSCRAVLGKQIEDCPTRYDLEVVDAQIDEKLSVLDLTIVTDPIPDLLFAYWRLVRADQPFSAVPMFFTVTYDDGEKSISTGAGELYLDGPRSYIEYESKSPITGNLYERFGADLLADAYAPSLGKGILYVSREMTTFPGGIENETIESIHDGVSDSLVDGAMTGFRLLRRYECEEYVRLGKGVFDGCSNLRAVVIDPVDGILPERTFRNCSALTLLDLYGPTGSPTYYGDYCFTNCSALTDYLHIRNASYIGKYAFSGTRHDLVEIRGNDDQPVDIQTGAFSNCPELSSCMVFARVLLHENAFSGNPKLTDLTLSWDILLLEKNIVSGSPVEEDSLFWSKLLKHVVGEIADEAVMGNALIERVDLNAEKIGKRAFCNCPNLELAALYEHVCAIGDEAFAQNPKLEYVAVGPVVPPTLGVDVFAGSFPAFGFMSPADESVYMKDPAWSVLLQ